MIGISGAALRTRRATRWVKSGLSMMTSASGRAAITASAVCRIRRRMRGSLRGIAPKPMIDSSCDVERARDPLLRHRAPADARRSGCPGARSRSARISAPPSASPDFLAATRWTVSGRPSRLSWRLVDAEDEQLRGVGRARDLLRFGDDRAPRHDRDAGEPRARRRLHGPRPDRRQVEAAVLRRLRRLDQHADARPASRCARARAARRPAPACCRCRRPPRPPAPGCPRPPPPARRRTVRSHAAARARARYRRGRAAPVQALPMLPRGIRISGATSCAPTMRKPRSSKIRATPESR